MNPNNASAPAPAGLPPFRALPNLIRENALAHPGHLAVRQGAARMTWQQLDRAAARVAATLQRHGVQPRESIAICGANSIPYLALFLGGVRAGLAVAPLPTGATAEQLAGMVRDAGARFFFTDGAVPAFDAGVPRIRRHRARGVGARPTRRSRRRPRAGAQRVSHRRRLREPAL